MTVKNSATTGRRVSTMSLHLLAPRIRRMSLVPGLLLIAVIVVPWYALLYARHGWGPVVGFFGSENVDRFMTSMVPGDQRPWFW